MSAFRGIRALQNLISDSIAIDMGSASTIISVHSRGVVVDEPSLVAVEIKTGEVIAAGAEAEQKYGREARDVRIIAPMLNGVVADFEGTKEMLASFVRRAGGLSSFARRALISVQSDVTPVEERALLSAAQHARIGRVSLIEEGLAAAFGSGVRAEERRGSAVVDIGAASTNIAIVASGNLVATRSERIGSSDIDAAVINHVRRHRGLVIGAKTAERLKLELASAVVPVDLGREIQISGREVITGLPGSIEIMAGEIYPVAQEVVRKIVEAISTTLTELPPEIAADIYDGGIILAGGGAQFVGLDDFLRDRTNLPVRIAEEPRYAVVRGLEQMFDEPVLPQRLLREGQQIEAWNVAM